MFICMNLDTQSKQACGGQSRDGARFCRECGKRLRLVLQLHNPGTRVGRYRIVQIIGHGSFGAVYEAEDTHHSGVKVALKEAFDSADIRSFQKEFAILQTLQHPHLPRYDDMFEEDGNGYLVMELVPGQSLEDVLTKIKKPLVESVVLGYALQLCDALSYLHQQNPPILHRDIKPANIRLTPEGLIKLVDFGLIKVGGGATRSSRRGLTEAYAPLEQWSRGKTDARSDLYSLGATLYHLFTNSEPRPAPERSATFPHDPLPPPQQLNTSLSPHVAQALITAMALQPQERYADAATFKQALLGIVVADPSKSAGQSHVATVPLARSATKANTTLLLSQSGSPEDIKLGLIERGASIAGSKANTTLIVSQTGGTPYQTISQAIKDAQPNSRILVRPGTYSESLTIDKPLTISGDGPVKKIIIESTDGYCLFMQTDHAEVRGLTLRCRAGTEGRKFFAVDIPQGQLVLSDCDITSDSLACVAIHGSTANPVIRCCKIHSGKASGIYVYQKGQGTVEDCEIFGNGLDGLSITEDGHPVIRRCKIHDCKESGVYVHSNGQGTVEDCEIFGNTFAGVMIREGGNPLIERCKIHSGKQSGIHVYKKGQGTVEDCEIFGNTFAGVMITEGGNPVIERCKIHSGKQSGIHVYEKGQGTVEDCEIFGNTFAGVMIREGGNPLIQRCKIHSGKASGVHVYEKGEGTVEDCEIFGNALAGVDIKEESNLIIRRCKIYNQPDHYGAYVHSNGQGTVEDCEIFGNALAGVAINQGGNPLIRGCKIHDGKQGGVMVYEKGQGTVEDCQIFGNALSGVEIKDESSPLIQRCKIHDGKQSGVYVHSNGQGTVEDCEIFGNANVGVSIKEGGDPLIQGCNINRNKYQAVWVHKNGAGRVENCDLTGNVHGAWDIEAGCNVQRSGNKE